MDTSKRILILSSLCTLAFGQYGITPNPGQPYKRGGPTNTNQAVEQAGPVTTCAFTFSPALSSTTGLIFQSYTGTGFSGGHVTGNLTPLAFTVTSRTTTGATLTFSSSSNVICTYNASGAQGAQGAAGANGANGTNGSNGATGATGPAAWTAVAAWAASTAYTVGPPANVVTYLGESYVTTTSHTSTSTFDGTKFTKLVTSGLSQVTSDPSGSCTAGVNLQFNNANGKLWGCTGTWVQITGGGGGSSNYTTVSYSATPTFAVTSGTGQAFLITLTGNVTSSTLTVSSGNPIITLRICQDATGSRTFVAPTNVLNMGTVDPTASGCSNQGFWWDGTNALAIGPMYVTGVAGGAITLPGATSGTNTVTPAATAGTGSTTTLPSGASVAPLVKASRTANQFVTNIDGTGTQNTAAIANADLPTAALNGVLKYTGGAPSAIGTSSTNCVHEDGSSGSCGAGGGYVTQTWIWGPLAADSGTVTQSANVVYLIPIPTNLSITEVIGRVYTADATNHVGLALYSSSYTLLATSNSQSTNTTNPVWTFTQTNGAAYLAIATDSTSYQLTAVATVAGKSPSLHVNAGSGAKWVTCNSNASWSTTWTFPAPCGSPSAVASAMYYPGFYVSK